MLPAVLQAEGEAPCFGTISSLTEQGLAFTFQSKPLAQKNVGQIAKLDFDLMGLHHSCKGLIVHVQSKRALLSLRETSTNVHAALQSINQDSMPTLATRLSTQQTQQACHAHFMQAMGAIIDHFYRALPDAIRARRSQATESDDLRDLDTLPAMLETLRPSLIRHFTVAYPMYPEQLDIPLHAASDDPINPADMARVDEWIRRTTIAQHIANTLDTQLDTFSHQYGGLLNNLHKKAAHPYQPDAILQRVSTLIAPLHFQPETRALCYEAMGHVFEEHAPALYAAMLRIIRDAPSGTALQVQPGLTLEQWLNASAAKSTNVQANGSAASVDSDQLNQLTALLGRLAAHLNADNPLAAASAQPALGPQADEITYIPGLLARDRIFSRFLPADFRPETTRDDTQGELALIQTDTAPVTTSPVLGGLADLDQAALQGLIAALRQQTPLELAPETLSPGSQIRALMAQAQGLLLEYTLNGLTYQSQPDHPAWILLNGLDTLHLGADRHGQFLDPALHQAMNLTMQWLLSQDDIDEALKQVNALLIQVNTQLRTERQQRLSLHLAALGALTLDTLPFRGRWCLVKHDHLAIPYEILGQHDGVWSLLDRSATHALAFPANEFLQKIEVGLIEETDSFDRPFFERIANASLVAGLHAVHAFTWQDPASGCLKRNALVDELERQLAHPVTEPSLFCALIEIPTMRPGRSILPRDELAVLQKQTGELLMGSLEKGEHCGRLSDVSFLMIFSPQDPDRLAQRLAQLKTEMEALHPVWKMIGAVVPLADGETQQTASNTLRRANLACTPSRLSEAFELSCLSQVPPPSNQIEPLPFSALFLRCQKIAACNNGGLSHYEVLLGIHDDLRPRHTTQSFVVMAEQAGLSHHLDAWVLKSALEWMDRQAGALETLSGLSVNLSGNSLTTAGHVDTMIELLARYPHLTHKLILEVTETAAIDNLEIAVHSLRALRNLGCRIALDDFGSGYSSYSYIRSLPLDYLKIDGTYIRNLLTDTTDQALTASMVDVAHALGLKVIAEYVDSEAVYGWLKNQGVDYVQGYWVHEPERLEDLVLN
ncbi:MAG TPA: EAL domain-containing protein [Thiobacillus sp.]